VIVFTTGLGAPQGFPFVPVIKITANPNTYEKLHRDHIDFFVDISKKVGTGFSQVGQDLYNEILAVASGKPTKSEISKYGNFPNIFTIGPVL
jgi:altronate dehydratase large subunit